jgi:hypothetical protein
VSNIGPEQSAVVLRIEGAIALFERALEQHVVAEAHWAGVGNEVQVDLAQWRQRYAGDRLLELRDELDATRSARARRRR